MTTTDDEFLKALRLFQPPLPREIEFRVYYNTNTGEILNYTNDDLPGDYILVDQETFARHRFDCKIKDGKIVPYRLPVGKLIPGDSGTPCASDDISIIASEAQPRQHWSMHTYED